MMSLSIRAAGLMARLRRARLGLAPAQQQLQQPLSSLGNSARARLQATLQPPVHHSSAFAAASAPRAGRPLAHKDLLPALLSVVTTPEQLERVMATRAATVSPSQLVLAMTRLAKLRPAGSDHQVRPQLSADDAAGHSTAAWAPAHATQPPVERDLAVMDLLALPLRGRASQLAPADLAYALWACGKLRYGALAPHATTGTATAAGAAADAASDGAGSSDTSAVVAGQSPLSEACQHGQQAEAASAPTASQQAARREVVDALVSALAADGCASTMTRIPATSLCNAAWALARLGRAEAELMAAICAQVQPQLRSLPAICLSSLSWALAMRQHRSAQMQAVIAAATAAVCGPSGTLMMVNTLLWSAAYLGLQDAKVLPALVSAWCAHVERRPNELAEASAVHALMAACCEAGSQVQASPLLRGVGDVLAKHAVQMGPEPCMAALSGFAQLEQRHDAFFDAALRQLHRLHASGQHRLDVAQTFKVLEAVHESGYEPPGDSKGHVVLQQLRQRVMRMHAELGSAAARQQLAAALQQLAVGSGGVGPERVLSPWAKELAQESLEQLLPHVPAMGAGELAALMHAFSVPGSVHPRAYGRLVAAAEQRLPSMTSAAIVGCLTAAEKARHHSASFMAAVARRALQLGALDAPWHGPQLMVSFAALGHRHPHLFEHLCGQLLARRGADADEAFPHGRGLLPALLFALAVVEHCPPDVQGHLASMLMQQLTRRVPLSVGDQGRLFLALLELEDTGWLQEHAAWRALPPPLLPRLRRFWFDATSEIKTSRLHQRAARMLEAAGLQCELEVATPDSLFVVDVLARKPGSRRLVAVEVDGPTHFSSNEPHVPTGATILHWRQLQRRFGSTAFVSLPFFELDNAALAAAATQRVLEAFENYRGGTGH